MSTRRHGIKIIERKTGNVVKFILCGTGRAALKVLSGVRRNMSNDYEAMEGFMDGKNENHKSLVGEIEHMC